MRLTEFEILCAGVIIVAGVTGAVCAALWVWIGRQAGRTTASRAAFARVKASVPQEPYTQADADAEAEAVGATIRDSLEDPPQPYAWGTPDQIDQWIASYKAKHGEDQR